MIIVGHQNTEERARSYGEANLAASGALPAARHYARGIAVLYGLLAVLG